MHAPVYRRIAQVFAVLLHPLFIPGVVAAWILLLHPIHIILLPEGTRVRLLAMVLLNTVFFPALVVFLLWRLGFISGIQLKGQKERITPLIISIIFYFWAWNVSRNLEDVPQALIQWLLGVFLCSCAAMFTNIFMKISLHTLAMGSLMVFSLLMLLHDPYWPHWMLHLSILLAGISGTARLLREAHRPGEVYAGYLAGAMCQLAAWGIAG